jgi:regulator of replication initiation timing
MSKRKLFKTPADLVEEIVDLKHQLKESDRLRDIDIKAKADYWEEANALRAENDRLREALVKIAKYQRLSACRIARAALRKGEE